MVGPITVKKPRPLDADLEEFLRDSGGGGGGGWICNGVLWVIRGISYS